ncbi:MAG: SDR family NAD(P)-dependent oxidoreductase [Rhodobacterales bacterium]|nr:SDR family NAD(P)-dependent oxidoreductase [Rhodobacterales bacterium]
MSLCTDRVVVITGAGRGIGRAHALAFAAEGAKVVVNDIGTSGRGEGASVQPAANVVAEILAAGGQAVAHFGDISSEEGAFGLVKTAIEHFGGLDVIVNNAGILRDRMFVSATLDEWDAVMKVHLRGHFLLGSAACAYWRAESKAGRQRQARIINTSSGAGLLGSVGQAAYSTAKGGIASLTLVQAAELGRYGVTANAIAPAARTRMTEAAFSEMMAKPDSGFDAMDPANVSPLVVWLGSNDSEATTGRIFEVQGGQISVAEGWRRGPEADAGRRWRPEEIGDTVRRLLDESTPPSPVYGAR